MKTIFSKFREISIILLNVLIIESAFCQTASIGLSGYTQNFDDLNVAVWTFPSLGTTTTPDHANVNNTTKVLTTQGAGIGAITDAAGVTSKAATANNWTSGNGVKWWQIEVNTTGYTGLTLSSKQWSSANGPEDFRVQYRIGVAGAWTNAGADIRVADNWTTGVLNSLSLPAACNNQASVFIRWIMRNNDAVSGGTVTNAGTSRIDDIVITSNNLNIINGWNYFAVPGDNASWSSGIPLTGNPSAASTDGLTNTIIVNNNAELKEYRSSSAYNLANSNSLENRSIGTSPTNVAAGIFQLRLVNNSGMARNTINLSYQIRRFATPTYFSGSNDNRLPGYQLFYSLNNGTSWTNASSFNPTTTNVPNSVGVTNVGCASIVLSSTLAIGGEIRFRWIDDNSDLSSPDQVVGLDSININFASCGLLPVKLNSFDAALNQLVTNISWNTEAESDFSHFELERSIDGINDFKKIGEISSGKNRYQFFDNLKNIPGSSFAYRLKMVDKNQSFGYSNTVIVRKVISSIQKMTLAPNPIIGNFTTLQLESGDAAEIQIRVIDLMGRLMLQQKNTVNLGMNSISIQNIERMQTGHYILQVVKGNEINHLKFSVY